MALDLEALHIALADQVRSYLGDDWNVAPFPYSGMDRPLIEVWPDSDYVNPWDTMTEDGLAVVMFRLVMTITPDWETEFKQITRALSIGTGHGSSLIDAVMSDRELGGRVDSLIAAPPGSPATWTPGNLENATTAEVPVVVYVRKQGAEV